MGENQPVGVGVLLKRACHALGVFGLEQARLLVFEGGKEKELLVTDLEAVGIFTDASLADEQKLLARVQRLDGDGPFLESCSARCG